MKRKLMAVVLSVVLAGACLPAFSQELLSDGAVETYEPASEMQDPEGEAALIDEGSGEGLTEIIEGSGVEPAEIVGEPGEGLTGIIEETDEESGTELIETEPAPAGEEYVLADGDGADSGTCGGSAFWTVEGSVLTISGSGAMDDYEMYQNAAPWRNWRESITKVTVEPGITKIGRAAFFGCTSVTEVNIPDSVTEIGQWALWSCSSLKSLKIPASVTSVGQNMLVNCPELTEITTPGLKNFSQISALGVCEKLTTIRIAEGTEEVGDSAFLNCKSAKEIFIPEGIKKIGTYAFAGCEGIETIGIPEGVTAIGNNAFYMCTGLSEIRIPEGVNSIEKQTFMNCLALSNVHLPESLTEIKDMAFYQCKGLQEIKIPRNTASIGKSAFMECAALETADIPDGMKSIGERAFMNCVKLANVQDFSTARYDLPSVTIPEGVTKIEYKVFYNCGSLSRLNIPENVVQIDDRAAGECTALKKICFYGGAPEGIHRLSFENVTADAYYPYDMLTGTRAWTREKRKDYGGTLNWIAWDPDTEHTLELILSDIDLALPMRASHAMTAEFSLENGPGIFWESSDKTIATVSRDGVITGRAPGRAVIRASAEGMDLFAECEVRVQFQDATDTGKYYYDAVNWASDLNITTGYMKEGRPTGLFGVEDSCTREQIVTFLWRMKGAPEPETLASFTDMKADGYYVKAVSWAAENGITTGISKDKFGVGQKCTRAMCVTFLHRAAGEPDAAAAGSAVFTDVAPGKYYEKAVAWASEKGITSGYNDKYGNPTGRFGPEDFCTRGQIVTFLKRFAG